MVIPGGADSTGNRGGGGTGAHAYTFTNGWTRGARWLEEQQTDKTALTITKALTKTTNCTRGAEKVDGHDRKKLFPAFRAGRAPPAPSHVQIRSGAIGDNNEATMKLYKCCK